MKTIVTGGAGFIGGNFMHFAVNAYPNEEWICLDKLTYAGNMETLQALEGKKNYKFVKGDIADREFIFDLFRTEKPDRVINFAAESHVDRSLKDPELFLRTNVLGTVCLMDACREFGIERYHQVSTDEVYGDLPLERTDLFFDEEYPIKTSSPFFFQGKCGPLRFGLSQNLRTSGDYFTLLKQLRSLSFPGEADSACYLQSLKRREYSGLR